MQLLIVAYADSLHTARGIAMLDETGWDIHLFDSNLVTSVHPALHDVTLHPASPVDVSPASGVRVAPAQTGPRGSFSARVEHLARVLDEESFDAVHGEGLLDGCALVDAVRRDHGLGPPWVASNWGSDLLWGGRTETFRPALRSVLAHCDYYQATCHRDVALARAFGFRGRVLGCWPSPGGLDLDHVRRFAVAPPSSRRAIVVKGQLSANSRGDVVLDAVERCAEALDGWELIGHTMHPDIAARAERLAEGSGIIYTHLSSDVSPAPHDVVLAALGRARVTTGLNRTDGITNVLIEAMATGAFAIVSTGSCGAELTPAGRGALFVDPTSVDQTAAALRRALTDDRLVDDAAALNAMLAARHLDGQVIRGQAIAAYERVVDESRRDATERAHTAALIEAVTSMEKNDPARASAARRELIARLVLDPDADVSPSDAAEVLEQLDDGAPEVVEDLRWGLGRAREAILMANVPWVHGEIEARDALEQRPHEELLEARAWAADVQRELAARAAHIEVLVAELEALRDENARLVELVAERDGEIARLGDYIRGIEA